MKTAKWIIAGLASAFAAGGALLANGAVMDAKFWFTFVGGFVFGLAGMTTNKVLDNAQSD